MTLKIEYRIAHLPKDLLDDIALFCKQRECTIERIWDAKPYSIRDMAMVHGLITHLGKKRYTAGQIAEASNQTRDKVIKVLVQSRTKDFPIRTQNYEVRT